MPGDEFGCLNQADPGHVSCQKVIKDREEEIDQLKRDLGGYKMFKRSMEDQSVVISTLNNQKKHLEEDVRSKENKITKITKMQQEARDRELKLNGELSKLKEQLTTAQGEARKRELNSKAEVCMLKQQLSADASEIGQLQERAKEMLEVSIQCYTLRVHSHDVIKYR